MIDIYYPYVNGLDKFQELRYSLRSVEMYAMFDYRIVIVGDLPEYINPDTVTYIPHVNCVGMKENVLYDVGMKLRQYLDIMPEGGFFMRMYDDIYFLVPMELEEIVLPKIVYELNDYVLDNRKQFNRSCDGTYWNQMKNTYHSLKAVLPDAVVISTESHCPEVFNKVLMRKVLNDFNIPENRLLTSTLYYNYFELLKPCMFEKTENVKAGFYGFHTQNRPDILKIVKGKKFLNHNNMGASNDLQGYIRQRFNVKSRFEK